MNTSIDILEVPTPLKCTRACDRCRRTDRRFRSSRYHGWTLCVRHLQLELKKTKKAMAPEVAKL